MKYSDDARKQLTEKFEGFRNKAYPDPASGGDPWTIGYGHTYNVRPGDTCTQEEADEYLEEDIAFAETAANRYITSIVSQCQFDAIVDFIFNVGVNNFSKSTLLSKINASDFLNASKEFNRWVYAQGRVMPGLVKRRAAETAWFLKDIPS